METHVAGDVKRHALSCRRFQQRVDAVKRSEIGFSIKTGMLAATSSSAIPRWNFGGVATIAASGFHASAAATSGKTVALAGSCRVARVRSGSMMATAARLAALPACRRPIEPQPTINIFESCL
jgi:hypothetical protein